MMKKMKHLIKNCPLAFAILLSWAAVAVALHLPLRAQQGVEIQNDIQSDMSWLEGQSQEITAYDMLSGSVAANRAPDLSQWAFVQTDDMQADSADMGDAGEQNTQEQIVTDRDEDAQEQRAQKVKPEYISYQKKKTDAPWYSDPGKIPQTTKYDYQTVETDYFDDAVFIGDSRIVGMNDYSGLTNATFFAKTGLTVYNLLDDEFVKDPDSGKNVSVSYMMQHHSYGKIYLMVGINELGTGNTERFQKAYKDVLKKFREWQPDAVIYVQSIMGVSPKKDRTDPVFNNTNIRDKNYAIGKLTDGLHIFYLNIQEIYEDKNHNLAQELTFDDVHLYAQHYRQWVEYLQTHAVVREKT